MLEQHNIHIYIYTYIFIIWLVVLTILKNMKVNGKDSPLFIMENTKCLKPPTRLKLPEIGIPSGTQT